MDTEQHLRRAAECILLSVESADPNEQVAMLNMAKAWLKKSKRARNSNHTQASEAA